MRYSARLLIFIGMFFSYQTALGLQTEASSDNQLAIEKAVFDHEVEGIKSYHLPNGLKILLYPDFTRNTFTLNITYLSGSRDENYSEEGVAHFTEHMLFKKTLNIDNIIAELSKRGADFNGGTTFDYTNYHETMINKDDNLEWALTMEADRMLNLDISQDSISTEMGVIENELDISESNTFNLLFRSVKSAAYDSHAYGKLSIGNRMAISSMNSDKIYAFYKKFYRPSNAVLTLSGNFDHLKALEIISKTFGSIENTGTHNKNAVIKELPQNGEKNIALRKPGGDKSVLAAYHTPSLAHSDMPAVLVFSQLLADEISGPLQIALVKKGYASSIGSFVEMNYEPGLSFFSAMLNPENSEELTKNILTDLIENFDYSSLSKDDLFRAKRKILNKYYDTITRSETIGRTLAPYSAAGDWRLFFKLRDEIGKVDGQSISRVSEIYFQASNRTVGIFIPTNNPRPTIISPTQNIEELVKEYTGIETRIATEKNYNLENLESSVLRENIGDSEVAMLSKKSISKKLIIKISLNFGNQQSTKGNNIPSLFVAPLLLKGSQSTYGRNLSAKLDHLQSKINVSAGPTGSIIEIETNLMNAQDVLNLLMEILDKPRFAKEDFEDFKNLTLSKLKSSENDLQSEATRAIQRAFMPFGLEKESIFYVPSLEENISLISSLRLEQVTSYYFDNWNAKNSQIAVVGEFEVHQIRSFASEFANVFKTNEIFSEISRPDSDTKAQKIVINIPGKSNVIYFGASQFKFNENDKNRAALALIGHIIGNSKDSRLVRRFRMQLGQSYSAGASINIGRKDSRGVLNIFVISNLAISHKISDIIKDEFRQIAQNGFEQKEIDDAKQSLVSKYQAELGDFDKLSDRLLNQMKNKSNFYNDETYYKSILNLESNEIMEAFLEYIYLNQMVEVLSGSF